MSKGSPKPVAQQTVTNETKLPSWLEPAMQRGVDRAEGIYQQGMPGYYPGSTVVPFAQQTTDALQMTENLARSNPNQAAIDNYNATVGGDYLYGGAGFNAALDAANARVIPQVQSMFSRAGRSGSGLAQTAMADAISNNFAGLYNQERGRQQQALSMAPQMAALQYQPAQMLAGVGAQYEDMAGRELQEDIDRYQYDANAPAMSLDQYLQRIQGIAPFAGGTTTQQTPIYQNRTNNLLGTLATGAGLLFGGAPFGAAGSGLLGLFR